MQPLLVVGVAGDIQSSTLVDGLARGTVYVPFQQQYDAKVTIVIRTMAGRPAADQIRRIVESTNRDVPIMTEQTLDESVVLGLMPQRILASVAGGFGIVGLLLAAIGIYGVTAYAVARRTREIGIRMALGARRTDIVRMALGEGLWLMSLGSAVGLALAAGASHVLEGFLFGIPPLDPITFAGITALFAGIGLAACYIPVRRATRIDPTEALRSE